MGLILPLSGVVSVQQMFFDILKYNRYSGLAPVFFFILFSLEAQGVDLWVAYQLLHMLLRGFLFTMGVATLYKLCE